MSVIKCHTCGALLIDEALVTTGCDHNPVGEPRAKVETSEHTTMTYVFNNLKDRIDAINVTN